MGPKKIYEGETAKYRQAGQLAQTDELVPRSWSISITLYRMVLGVSEQHHCPIEHEHMVSSCFLRPYPRLFRRSSPPRPQTIVLEVLFMRVSIDLIDWTNVFFISLFSA